MQPLSPTLLLRAEHEHSTYFITLPDFVTLEDAQNPAYWAHTADKLRQFDIIEFIAADFTWYAQAIVAETGDCWAKLKLLNYVRWELELPDETIPEGYDVKWQGPLVKWGVIRLSDSERIRSGEPNKSSAIAWVQKFVKK